MVGVAKDSGLVEADHWAWLYMEGCRSQTRPQTVEKDLKEKAPHVEIFSKNKSFKAGLNTQCQLRQTKQSFDQKKFDLIIRKKPLLNN